MKNALKLLPGLALGVVLAISGIGLAQNAVQTDPKKEKESCCAMSCCKGDSCSMKDHKNHSSKHEGCCCGDSCDMDMKDMKNGEKGN